MSDFLSKGKNMNLIRFGIIAGAHLVVLAIIYLMSGIGNGDIGDEQIAVLDVMQGVFLQQVVHQANHGGQMDRQRIFRLNNQAAARIANRRGVIPAFLDVGGIGAAHQRDIGLVGDGAQRVEQNFQRD